MIRPGTCRSAKLEFLTGVHQPTDVYKIALYGADADLSPSWRVYSSRGEVSGLGYEPGGRELCGYEAREDATGAGIGWCDDVKWPMATIEAAGALIYNTTRGNKALAVLQFKEPVKSVVGPFIVWMSKLQGPVVRIV